MVQLSKRKVKPEAMDKMVSLLFDVLGRQGDQNCFNIIIDGLFSPIEKIMIAKRVAIFFLIIKGEEWKTIRDIVKVSMASVSKCQMVLKNNSEMQCTLNTLISKKEMGIFIEELILLIFGPGTAYVNWKSAWRRKKQLEQKQTEIL